MIEYIESEMYLRRIEQEVANKLKVSSTEVIIMWHDAVDEHCVYVCGQFYGYLNNEGSVDVYE